MYWKFNRANIIGLAALIVVLAVILFAVLNPVEEHDSPEVSVPSITPGPPREMPGKLMENENDDPETVTRKVRETHMSYYPEKSVTICKAQDLEEITEINVGASRELYRQLDEVQEYFGGLCLEEEVTDPPRLVYLGTYTIVGYDTCEACCGKSDGITASGTVATVGRTVATGCEFLFGTVLWIPGIGERVVEDVGNVKPGVIDVLCADHESCYAITGQYHVYRVVEPRGADEGQTE